MRWRPFWAKLHAWPAILLKTVTITDFFVTICFRNSFQYSITIALHCVTKLLSRKITSLMAHFQDGNNFVNYLAK